jgi:hypothetical protein
MPAARLPSTCKPKMILDGRHQANALNELLCRLFGQVKRSAFSLLMSRSEKDRATAQESMGQAQTVDQ